MDIAYLLWWQGLRESLGGALDGLVLFVSAFGEETIPMLIVFSIYWCFSKKQGVFLLFSFCLGTFVNGLLKLTCCVYRPWIRDARVTPVPGALGGATGYSFPSGHSTNAAAVYGGLGWLNREKKWLSGAMLALTLLIMLSRNYLGVHTPQDVVAGAATGLWMVVAARWLLHWADGGKPGGRRDLVIACVGTALCAASLLYVSLKGYPMDWLNGELLADPAKMQRDHFSACGALLGLLWGWLWERRAIRFQPPRSFPVCLARLAAGMAVTLFLYTLVRKGLISVLGPNYGRMAGALISILYATAAHPLLFTWAERTFHAPGKQRGASAQDAGEAPPPQPTA